ncbi:hypothetical protein IFM89_002403 [Coptis chinensis]|uniref:30S ribosomal protein S8, chloroplastic n=1 Tax=Coptis chinensis TaxID=261450 RepID=A0A835ILE9_9MAGN|nr:hypothetical protein IFM89_002403 [Coptis chinensis]
MCKIDFGLIQKEDSLGSVLEGREKETHNNYKVPFEFKFCCFFDFTEIEAITKWGKMGRRILNDALRTMVNAERRGKATANLKPVSNAIAAFLKIMKNRGYIKDYQVADMNRVGKITVELQGRIKDCRALTYRQDLKAKEIDEFKIRTLPTRQAGEHNRHSQIDAMGLCCDHNSKWCFGSRRGQETECGGPGSWLFSLNRPCISLLKRMKEGVLGSYHYWASSNLF